MCVYEWERERDCVCVCVRERKGEKGNIKSINLNFGWEVIDGFMLKKTILVLEVSKNFLLF